MLLCEDLRRSHDTGLIAVVDGNEHRHQGHKGLARPHIPLQKTVHLSSGTYINADLPDHSLLRFREREGQIVAVEGIEDLAHLGEDIPPVFPALVARVP